MIWVSELEDTIKIWVAVLLNSGICVGGYHQDVGVCVGRYHLGVDIWMWVQIPS